MSPNVKTNFVAGTNQKQGEKSMMTNRALAVRVFGVSFCVTMFALWVLSLKKDQTLQKPEVKSAVEMKLDESGTQTALTSADHLAAAKQMLKAKLVNGYHVGPVIAPATGFNSSQTSTAHRA